MFTDKHGFAFIQWVVMLQGEMKAAQPEQKDLILIICDPEDGLLRLKSDS